MLSATECFDMFPVSPLKKPQHTSKPPIQFKLWAEKCLFHNYKSTRFKLTFLEPTKGTSPSPDLSFQEIFNHTVNGRNIRVIKTGWVYLCLHAWGCNSKYQSSDNSEEKALNSFQMTYDATSTLALHIAFVCLAFQKLLCRNSDRMAIVKFLCSVSLE